MDRAACHGSEHPPPPPDRPLAARGPGRKPWHILGENGWRILTENLQAWLRPVYLGLLVPHIVLAALVVPLALTTIYRAWRGHFDRHGRLARVTPPIWLYVSVSGVLVYVLLYDARSLRRNGRRRRVLVPLPIGGRRAALNGGDDEKAALRVEVEEDAPVPEAPTIGPERLFRELEAVAGGGRLAHLLDG